MKTAKKIIVLWVLVGLVLSLSGCGTFLFERQAGAGEFEQRWLNGGSNQTMYNPGSKHADNGNYRGPIFGFEQGEDVHWLFGKFGQDWLWHVDDKGEIQCCF
jgi:hypothetical protein